MSSLSLTLLVKYSNIKCQCVMEIRRGKKSYYLWQCDWSQVLLISFINQVWHFVPRLSSKEHLKLNTASSWAHGNENTVLYWDRKLSSHKTGIHCWSLRWVLPVPASIGVRQSHFWANTKRFWTPWNWGLRQPVPESLFSNRAVSQDVFWVGETYTLFLL